MQVKTRKIYNWYDERLSGTERYWPEYHPKAGPSRHYQILLRRVYCHNWNYLLPLATPWERKLAMHLISFSSFLAVTWHKTRTDKGFLIEYQNPDWKFVLFTIQKCEENVRICNDKNSIKRGIEGLTHRSYNNSTQASLDSLFIFQKTVLVSPPWASSLSNFNASSCLEEISSSCFANYLNERREWVGHEREEKTWPERERERLRFWSRQYPSVSFDTGIHIT